MEKEKTSGATGSNTKCQSELLLIVNKITLTYICAYSSLLSQD